MKWSYNRATSNISKCLAFIKENALTCIIVLWICSLALPILSCGIETVMISRLEDMLANKTRVDGLEVRIIKLENSLIKTEKHSTFVSVKKKKGGR